MSTSASANDALDFLRAAQGLPLATVQHQFRDLRARHPGVELELLWERQSYDILLRPPGGGTISLGYAADHTVPWLLRNACHSHECDVATVNSRLIDIQTVVGYLDIVWNDARLLDQMVDDQLIDEAVEQLGIEPSREDIDAAVLEFRTARGLFRADDAIRWMHDHGITQERLEWIVSRDSAARALRRHVVTDAQVEARLTSDFDTVRIARFRADRCDGEFFAAAQAHFAAGGNCDRFFTVLTRRDLTPEQAAMIFGAAPGSTLAGVPSGDGFDVVHILAFVPAQAHDVERAIFAEWLAERRKTARVEWFWGNATAPS